MASATQDRRTKVFISYSRKDDAWKERLMSHMAVLEGEGLLHVWADSRIEFGEDWSAQIEAAMEESKIAILLVSANFLTSKYILSIELPRFFRRHAEDGMFILPVIAKPCAWRLVEWLAKRQARPDGGRPISAGDDVQVDLDLTAITTEVAFLINRIDGREAEAQLLSSESLIPRIPRYTAGAATHNINKCNYNTKRDNAIDAAFAAIDDAFDELQDPSRSMIQAAIPHLIEVAISYGVPTYNSGSHLGCAIIYAYAAKRVLGLLTQRREVGSTEQRFVEDARLILSSVEHSLGTMMSRNAIERAWQLRDAFDHILRMAPR